MMASVSDSNLWSVKTYSINAKDIVGKGAYGIVYCGRSPTGETIAAKRIDCKDKDKASRISKDLAKLLGLKHPNIVDIFDLEKEEKLIWILMEYCPHGDLNMFFEKSDIGFAQKLEIMSQIAQGVEYLHRNDIIHRDIKPGNILVQNNSPVQIRLTDFDVSKFLEAEIETSVMTSNVGTNAFKAPEFFMRNEQKKISYHRSVDVYAAGLTFLALLQHDKEEQHKENTMLIPRIETPRDQSELHVPIGQLIAERIKYNVQNRAIVVFNKSNTLTDEHKAENQVRELIQEMTSVEPKDRLSAFGICHSLSILDMEKCVKRLKTHHEGVPHGPDTNIQVLPFKKAKSVEILAKCIQQEVHEDMLEEKSVKPGLMYETRMTVHSMCLNSQDQLLLFGNIGASFYMRMQDEKCIKDIPSLCNHDCCLLNEVPDQSDYVLQLCKMCENIISYQLSTGQGTVAYKNSRLSTITTGPTGTLLVRDFHGKTFQLFWNHKLKELNFFQTVQILPKYEVDHMCYSEKHGILVLITRGEDVIHTVKWQDKSLIWEFRDKFAGRKIDPYKVCCNRQDQLYVVDYTGKRVVGFNILTGKLISVLKEENSLMKDVCWSVRRKQLLVSSYTGTKEVISWYNLSHE